MKKFPQIISAEAVRPSRRDFIAGSAAVAGGGLALGLAATWSSAADAQGIAPVGAITHTTFTEEDISIILSCFVKGRPKWWIHSDIGENQTGWLLTTPMNPKLAPHVWRFNTALSQEIDPQVSVDYWDLTLMMIGGGRLVEVSAGLDESYLSDKAIVESVSALCAYAKKLGPLVAADVVIVVSARSDKHSDDRLERLYRCFDALLEEGGCSYIETSIEAGKSAKVTLWIAKEWR